VSPALSPLCSALERAAQLIEKGASPAKALRQVSAELQDYADRHPTQQIPGRVFDFVERKAA
jgi:hypothetical protein